MNLWYIAFDVLILILIGLAVYVAYFKKRKYFTGADIEMIQKRFADLEKKLHWDPRYVVMEGDKLLDFLLMKMRFKGPLGQKLKKAGKLFSHEQDLWNAHKLRNSLAHEMGFSVDIKQARAALKAYKSAFEQCGITFTAHE